MPALPDLIGLIGLQPMQRVAIFVGEDRDRLRPQFVSRTECADRNFSTICDEDF